MNLRQKDLTVTMARMELEDNRCMQSRLATNLALLPNRALRAPALDHRCRCRFIFN